MKTNEAFLFAEMNKKILWKQNSLIPYQQNFT